MLGFKLVNKNPKNRKTGDCSTRALCNILDIDYKVALHLQYEESCKSFYDLTSRQTFCKILERFGYVKVKQPRKSDNTYYTVRELDRVLSDEEMKDGVIIGVPHHWTVVRNGYIEDTWNCGDKRVGNYWVKKK